MHLVSSAQMRAIEAAADASGLSYAEMMRRAGHAVAGFTHDRYPEARVVVLTGPGNNGGDGLVAASELAALGHAVAVFLCRRTVSPTDPLIAAVTAQGVAPRPLEDPEAFAALRRALAGCDVVLDALLGTGLTRRLSGAIAEVLDLVQSVTSADPSPVVIAVDVPTGLDADTGALDPLTVPATVTVTFGCPKLGHVCPPGSIAVGELIVDDLGIPDGLITGDVVLAAADDVRRLLPRRPLDGHKGSFGKTLIVAGSLPYTGAAALAGLAAYRAGSGLVSLALPSVIQAAVAALVPEATFVALPDEAGHLAPTAARALAAHWVGYDALLLGPGLGVTDATRAFLRQLLDQSGAPERWLVDADGLNLLAEAPEMLLRLPTQTVLTPHPGEMGRLLGCSAAEVNADRLGIARAAALDWGHVIVLKGAYSVVAGPDGRLSVNPFATAALATAGSGDVLAGLVAGLLAQGLPPYDAAVVGTWLHGWAGQHWAKQFGPRGALARDLVDGIVGAFQAADSA